MASKGKPEAGKSLIDVTRREPLAEPACRVVDAVRELLLAAAKGEYVDEGFSLACQKYGLVMSPSQPGNPPDANWIPSDLGIINFLQPLLDAAFHSRHHRQMQLEQRREIAFKAEEDAGLASQREAERVREVLDKVDDKFIIKDSLPIDAGLFMEAGVG